MLTKGSAEHPGTVGIQGVRGDERWCEPGPVA